MVKILAIGDFQGVFPAKLKKELNNEEFDLIIGVGDYRGIEEWRPFVWEMFRRLKRGQEKISPQEFFGKKKFKALLKKDWLASKKVLKELDKLGKSIYLVFGNTDDELYNHPYYKRQKQTKKAGTFLKSLKNIKIINYGQRKFKGVNIFGFGGYMDIDAYFNQSKFKSDMDIIKRKKIYLSMEKRFFKMLNSFKNNKSPKLFVFHYPPKGIFDIIKDRNNPMDRESAGVRFYSEGIKRYKPLAVFCGHMHEYRGIKKLYGVPVINPGDAENGKAAIIDIDEFKGKVKKVKFIG